jgi:CheY-like chemotaxis protein
MKILLADDMKSFLDLERSFLSRAECELYTAATGIEAVKLATRLQPDLILLDIEMPEMTGIEACRILKSTPATQKIPVVIITASDRQEDSRKAGADDFARKPLDEVMFLALVRKHAGLKERSDLRVPFASEVVLRGTSGEFIGMARDLSVSGMAIRQEGRPAIGDQVVARFTIPLAGGTQTVMIACVVVRQLEDGVAVRFFDMTSGAVLAIQEFMNA